MHSHAGYQCFGSTLGTTRWSDFSADCVLGTSLAFWLTFIILRSSRLPSKLAAAGQWLSPDLDLLLVATSSNVA